MPDYQIPGRVPDDSTPRDTFTDYWRDRYTAEPYYDDTLLFDDYEPAYRIGHAARAQETRADQIIRAYEQVEAELQAWRSPTLSLDSLSEPPGQPRVRCLVLAAASLAHLYDHPVIG